MLVMWQLLTKYLTRNLIMLNMLHYILLKWSHWL